MISDKLKCANRDFDLILETGTIAFYKGCEVTQIFIFDKVKRTAVNFYTLFVFDEADTIDAAARFLLDKMQSLTDRYSFGIIQKRITIENARTEFQNIQNGQLNFDTDCQISPCFTLLPKAYIPQLSLLSGVLLNNVLKPNYWGDSYIIEFFDEKKELFEQFPDDNNRAFFDRITDFVKNTASIKIDLGKVYDRIGNIIFQFPITVYGTEVNSRRNDVDIQVTVKPHPLLHKGKKLQISVTATLDNVITGFDSFTSDELVIDHVFHVGDDNELKTVVYDLETKLILHQSEVAFWKDINFSVNSGMHNSKPRSILYRNPEKHIDYVNLFSRDSFGTGRRKDYEDLIRNRNINNELLKHSEDYSIQKFHEEQKALTFIKKKLDTFGIKEICLWDPYLRAADIIETVYFEKTGIPLRCITSYQKAKNSNSEKNEITSFRELIKQENEYFKTHSNNLGVTLKYVAQHDNYGWKFHDRFLLLIPEDDMNLPVVYSLGTSVNSLGMHHHIIQKVTNARVILNNFEELWRILDNKECTIAVFPQENSK